MGSGGMPANAEALQASSVDVWTKTDTHGHPRHKGSKLAIAASIARDCWGPAPSEKCAEKFCLCLPPLRLATPEQEDHGCFNIFW